VGGEVAGIDLPLGLAVLDALLLALSASLDEERRAERDHGTHQSPEER
jgi:hypothetical protein